MNQELWEKMWSSEPVHISGEEFSDMFLFSVICGTVLATVTCGPVILWAYIGDWKERRERKREP